MIQAHYYIDVCTLGYILVAESKKGLCAIFLGDKPNELIQQLERRFSKTHLIACDMNLKPLVSLIIGLIESPKKNDDLPFDLCGTEFQQLIWHALRKIPLGSTSTYTDIAKQVGLPKAARAVALACAANPLPVVIPCHRVIRKDGSLSGYRWGVERKEILLEREKKFAQR